MKPGVSYPSYRDGATWSGSGWSTDYPVGNVADCVYLSHVARAASPATSVNLNFSLPGAVPIQFIALANHNLQAGDLMRVRLYSDAAFTTLVSDTGSIQVWPGGSVPSLKADGTPRYRQTRPLLFSSPITARSGRIDITPVSVTAEVGGVDIAGWWAWRGISLGRDTGIDSRETAVSLVGGADYVPPEFNARQINGQINYMALGATGTDTAFDFQSAMDIDRPFCFVNDTDDPTSWPRLALMVTNVQLPPLTGAAYRHDTFAFKFNEAFR